MTDDTFRQRPVDVAAATLVLAFAAAMSLFALRNNDVWWSMAVGRYILETKSFITTDPFTFTAPGAPWSPQSWLAGIVFYLAHGAAGAPGLIALRVLLVLGTVTAALAGLRRLRVSWAAASPLIVLFVLVAHTRFIVRAHLFEYLFIALMLGALMTWHRRSGRVAFALPVVVQVLWANSHPSFLLGPALAALFFAGEWLGERLAGSAPVRAFERHDYRRAGVLVALLALACLANPSPVAFLTQPFAGEQRELMSRFTLEWKSPFDPAIASASFHPWYEIVLALAAAALLLHIRRIPPAALLLLLSTALLSLQSHRFRVEFALAALFVVPLLARDATALRGLAARHRTLARYAPPIIALALVAGTAGRLVEVGTAVRDRYPTTALDFIRDNGVAVRPFHTIGFGSYMTWHLYGERLTFIDGRNFDSTVYRDFLACQSGAQGFDAVARKYRLDGFVVPPVGASDAGITNVHRELVSGEGWSLVHLDPLAYVYVRDDSVPAEWLRRHAFRAYHPLLLQGRRLTLEMLEAVIGDLERAVRESPDYLSLKLDLALTHAFRGNAERAEEVLERAAAQSPNRLRGDARAGTAHLTLARYYMERGDRGKAMLRVGSVLEIDPQNETALAMRRQLLESGGR